MSDIFCPRTPMVINDNFMQCFKTNFFNQKWLNTATYIYVRLHRFQSAKFMLKKNIYY